MRLSVASFIRYLDDDRHDRVDYGHRGRHDGSGDHRCRLRDPGDGLQLLGQTGSEVVGLGRKDDDRRPCRHLREGRVRCVFLFDFGSVYLASFEPDGVQKGFGLHAKDERVTMKGARSWRVAVVTVVVVVVVVVELNRKG